MRALHRRRQQHRGVQRQQRPAQPRERPGGGDVEHGAGGMEAGRADEAAQRSQRDLVHLVIAQRRDQVRLVQRAFGQIGQPGIARHRQRPAAGQAGEQEDGDDRRHPEGGDEAPRVGTPVVDREMREQDHGRDIDRFIGRAFQQLEPGVAGDDFVPGHPVEPQQAVDPLQRMIDEAVAERRDRIGDERAQQAHRDEHRRIFHQIAADAARPRRRRAQVDQHRHRHHRADREGGIQDGLDREGQPLVRHQQRHHRECADHPRGEPGKRDDGCVFVRCHAGSGKGRSLTANTAAWTFAAGNTMARDPL